MLPASSSIPLWNSCPSSSDRARETAPFPGIPLLFPGDGFLQGEPVQHQPHPRQSQQKTLAHLSRALQRGEVVKRHPKRGGKGISKRKEEGEQAALVSFHPWEAGAAFRAGQGPAGPFLGHPQDFVVGRAGASLGSHISPELLLLFVLRARNPRSYFIFQGEQKRGKHKN